MREDQAEPANHNIDELIDALDELADALEELVQTVTAEQLLAQAEPRPFVAA
jgi:hypothetical protein